MAGHIQDRWYKTEPGPDDKPVKTKTDRHGTGMRYQARYVGPDEYEKSKSFPDRQRRLADQWLNDGDRHVCRYVRRSEGRAHDVPSVRRALAERPDDGPHDASGRRDAAAVARLPSHRIAPARLVQALPHPGTRAGVRRAAPIEGGYGRTIYANVRAVLSAAVDDGYLSRNPCNAGSVRPPAVDPTRVVPWTPAQVLAVRGTSRQVPRHGGHGRRLRAPARRSHRSGRRRCDRLRQRPSSRAATGEAHSGYGGLRAAKVQQGTRRATTGLRCRRTPSPSESVQASSRHTAVEEAGRPPGHQAVVLPPTGLAASVAEQLQHAEWKRAIASAALNPSASGWGAL